ATIAWQCDLSHREQRALIQLLARAMRHRLCGAIVAAQLAGALAGLGHARLLPVRLALRSARGLGGRRLGFASHLLVALLRTLLGHLRRRDAVVPVAPAMRQSEAGRRDDVVGRHAERAACRRRRRRAGLLRANYAL